MNNFSKKEITFFLISFCLFCLFIIFPLKIKAAPPCWGIGGSCDSGCTYNSTSSASYYYWIDCSASYCPTAAYYTGSGSCNGSGSGNCYKLTGSTTAYSTCTIGAFCGTPGTCSGTLRRCNVFGTDIYTCTTICGCPYDYGNDVCGPGNVPCTTRGSGVCALCGCTLSSGTSKYYSTVSNPVTVYSGSTQCTWIPLTTFTVTVNKVGTGTVTSNPAGINCGSTCNYTFNPGSVTLTATGSGGYAFTGWSGGGCSGTSTCTVSTTVTVTATFTKVTLTITPSVSSAYIAQNESISLGVQATVTGMSLAGQEVWLYISPKGNPIGNGITDTWLSGGAYCPYNSSGGAQYICSRCIPNCSGVGLLISTSPFPTTPNGTYPITIGAELHINGDWNNIVYASATFSLTVEQIYFSVTSLSSPDQLLLQGFPETVSYNYQVTWISGPLRAVQIEFKTPPTSSSGGTPSGVSYDFNNGTPPFIGSFSVHSSSNAQQTNTPYYFVVQGTSNAAAYQKSVSNCADGPIVCTRNSFALYPLWEIPTQYPDPPFAWTCPGCSPDVKTTVTAQLLSPGPGTIVFQAQLRNPPSAGNITFPIDNVSPCTQSGTGAICTYGLTIYADTNVPEGQYWIDIYIKNSDLGFTYESKGEFLLVVGYAFYINTPDSDYRLTQGETISNIPITVTNGANPGGYSVGFSIDYYTPLPLGVHADWSSLSCNPTCTVYLDLIADSTATAGGPITINVCAGSQETLRCDSFNLTVYGFYFSLDFPFPPAGTVCQGNSTQATIKYSCLYTWPHHELPPLTCEPINFSVSAPEGTGVGVSPGSFSCVASCSQVLSISTIRTATIGTHAITVTGTTLGKSETGQYALTVTERHSFDFNLSPSSNSGTVNKGRSISIQIGANLPFDCIDPGTVNFEVSGLPPGTSPSWSNSSCSPNCSTTLTISTTASTPPGVYPLTISGIGSGGAGTKSFPYTLTVTEFKFSLPADSAGKVLQGGQIQVPLTITKISGNPETVSFSVSALSGALYSFNSPNCPDLSTTCTTTLTITTSASTTPANTAGPPYQLIITGTGGPPTWPGSDSMNYDLTVYPDFSLSRSPSSHVVVQGTMVYIDVSATLTTAGPGSLVTFDIDPLTKPPGIIYNFTVPSCTPTSNPTSCSTQLIIDTTAIPFGTYPSIKITGSDGYQDPKTKVYSLLVAQPGGFGVFISPDTATVEAGDPVPSSNVDIYLINPGSDTIDYQVSSQSDSNVPLPAGLVVDFVPPASCDADPSCDPIIMNISAGSLSPGTYEFWVRGTNDGGLTWQPSNLYTLTINTPPVAAMECLLDDLYNRCNGPGCVCDAINWETYDPTNSVNYVIKNNSYDPEPSDYIVSSKWSMLDMIGVVVKGPYPCPESNIVCDFTIPRITPGPYIIKLEVTDNHLGRSSNVAHDITIKRDITADFMCALTNEPETTWTSCQSQSFQPPLGHEIYFKDDQSLPKYSYWSEGASSIIARGWIKKENPSDPGASFVEPLDTNNPSPSITLAGTIIKLTVTDDTLGGGRSASKEYLLSGSLLLPEWIEIPPFQ